MNAPLRCPDCGREVSDKDAVYCDDDGARLVRTAPAPRAGQALFIVSMVGLGLIATFAYLVATESPVLSIDATAVAKTADSTPVSNSDSNKQLASQLLQTCFGTEPKLPPTVGEDQSDILKIGKNLARQSTDMFSDLAGLPKLSDSDRKSAGNVLAKSIFEQYGRPKASPSGPRIEKIAAKLQETTKRENDLCCNFQVLPSKDFNAYMGPGGRGYVLEGLISKAQSDDQLAFVIGHEISHSLLEHPDRSLRVSLAAQRAGKELTGSDAGGETTEFIAAVTTGMLSKTYSQDQEYEADRLGLCLAYLAGYQPNAGAEFMNIMGQVARDHSAPSGGAKRIAYDLLSSHPPSADRRRYQDSLTKILSKQNNQNRK